MLTPRAPSFHIGAGGAFAENDSTSDVLCRLVAPAGWLQTNCQLLLSTLLSSLPSHVDRETRIVPPSPRFEEPSVSSRMARHEKMEERLRTPSIVSVALRASAEPRGLSAVQPRHLTAPDRATHHASSLTIWRDACAPFRYAHWCHPASSRSVRALARFTTPPAAAHPVGGEPPPPASAVNGGLRQARSPFYGLPCGVPRSSTSMRTDRFLLPTASTTSTRASSVPGISSKLSLRPWAVGLHPSPGDRGT